MEFHYRPHNDSERLADLISAQRGKPKAKRQLRTLLASQSTMTVRRKEEQPSVEADVISGAEDM